MIALLSTSTITGCATETHRTIQPQTVATYKTAYQGQQVSVAIGKFQNSSSYLNGLFASGNDKLGSQGKTILKTHLQQTGRFKLVDRENMNELKQEANFSGSKQSISGARFVVTGSVTEFGRKEVGDRQFFGILGSGKRQIAYSKVSINVVDVVTSQVVYSTQGAGEYELSNREIVGFGGTAGYDATLNGKVMNLSITEAVNNLTRDLDLGVWGK
ncbi:MAG: CsgG/HfaB family protein [Pseudomonadales bacterium]|nr:CsgG/HfaB family protein [Pseudomonadales bacterium]